MSDPPSQSPGGGRRTARALALLLITAFAGLLAWGLLTTSRDGIDASLADGRAPPAPSFDLAILRSGQMPARLAALAPAFTDQRVALSELDGTPVVLNIWASWCGPCREEAPVLERSWRYWGPRGVLFLGLNIQDVPEDARRFLDEVGVGYPSVREPSNRVARTFGSIGLPDTYFISADGRVVGHVLGVVSPEQLAAGARAAKSGRVIETGPGGASRQLR